MHISLLVVMVPRAKDDEGSSDFGPMLGGFFRPQSMIGDLLGPAKRRLEQLYHGWLKLDLVSQFAITSVAVLFCGMVAIAVKHQQPDVLVQRHER